MHDNHSKPPRYALAQSPLTLTTVQRCCTDFIHTILFSAGAQYRPQRSAPTRNGINTSSLTYIEVLRGRDGRDGRDGLPGPHGPQGQRGEQGVAGPPGPRNGGVVYTTQGGGKEVAQMSLERSWCMQEGLEEAGLPTLEEVPTTSACPMIQTNFNTNLE